MEINIRYSGRNEGYDCPLLSGLGGLEIGIVGAIHFFSLNIPPRDQILDICTYQKIGISQ